MFGALCLNLVIMTTGIGSVTRQWRQPARNAQKVNRAVCLAQKATFMSKKLVEDPERHFTLHGAKHSAKGSVILLAPWAAYEGWWKEWLKHTWDELIQQEWRILEAVGKIYQHPDAPYRGWYNYASYEDWVAEIPNATQFDNAVRYVHGLIQQEYNIVKDYRRIVIAGYSQGAVLSLEAGLRFPMPLGLVFSQRGVLLDKRLNNCTSVVKTPYIFTAGSLDDVYLESDIETSCSRLMHVGASAFMTSIAGLDHYDSSERENTFLSKSIKVVMSQSPSRALESIESLGDWTPC